MADKSRNLVAALSYLMGVISLGFITGIIILFVEKDDRFIRFHAWQSVIIGSFFFILAFFINWKLGFASSFLSSIVYLINLVVAVISMVKAYQGELFKWPAAGDFAEKQVK